jgi:hypothetical protein
MIMISNWPVFLGLTVCIFGIAAWLTGAALAVTWRPYWQVVLYSLLLALFDRFLSWSLFGAPLTSLGEFVRDFGVITVIGLLAWRLRRGRLMVSQYPWLFERAGPLSWRRRESAGEAEHV